MVRTRSEEKRREIIRVAADTFQELGYEGTSMLTIAERMSGSKQTLYNHFSSKDQLLRAVLMQDVGEGTEMIIEAMGTQKNLRKALERLSIAYLERRLAPQQIANIRIVAGQSANSGLGEEFWNNILRPAGMQMSQVFERLMDEGRLRRDDPWKVTVLWKGLVEQDLFERRLIGAMRKVDHKEIEAAAKAATDVFLRAFGTEGQATRNTRA